MSEEAVKTRVYPRPHFDHDLITSLQSRYDPGLLLRLRF